MIIRDERPEDPSAIHAVIRDAFAPMPFSDGSEAELVDRLRQSGGLSLSLVAERDGEIVGHIGFSPVTVDDMPGPWRQLAPVSVRPDLQRRGIGSALIRAGLVRLESQGIEACFVLGDPEYYPRCGFAHTPSLSDTYPQPNPYFMALSFAGGLPRGTVRYHPAFTPD